MAGKPQYSLRTLFVVTAVVALLLGQAEVFPRGLAKIVGLVVSVLLFTGLVSGTMYLGGARRTFCIGVLVSILSVGAAKYFVIGQLWDGGRIDLCISWLLIGAGGLVAVAVHRLATSESAEP